MKLIRTVLVKEILLKKNMNITQIGQFHLGGLICDSYVCEFPDEKNRGHLFNVCRVPLVGFSN